jgi:hypothetical protein
LVGHPKQDTGRGHYKTIRVYIQVFSQVRGSAATTKSPKRTLGTRKQRCQNVMSRRSLDF